MLLLHSLLDRMNVFNCQAQLASISVPVSGHLPECVFMSTKCLQVACSKNYFLIKKPHCWIVSHNKTGGGQDIGLPQ